MKNDFEEQLISELKDQGAFGEEARDLMGIFNKVSKVSEIERSHAFKKSFLDNLWEKEKTNKKIFFFMPRVYVPALALVFLLFILITEVVNAQKSLPGQPLYPIKILSENVIKTVNPGFRDEILRRRSEEVKSLTEQKKDSGLLKKTIDQYSDELKEKDKINPDSAEKTKKNLEDAKENSANADKKEIENAIIQTENKIIQNRHEEQKKEDSSIQKDVKGEETKATSTPKEEIKKSEDTHREDKKQGESTNLGD